MTSTRRESIRADVARVVWLLYWLVFAGLVVRGGFEPGLVPDRQLVPYPWQDVIGMICLFGAVTFVIYRILSPARSALSWRRWAPDGSGGTLSRRPE